MRESHSRLLAKGVQVQVLAPSWKGLGNHRIDQIQVDRFRYAPADLEILTHDEGAPSKLAKRPWMQLLAIPYILSGAMRCAWICFRNKPAVLHAHWPFPHGLMALVSKWIFRIPLVLNFHGAELLLVNKHPWVKHVLRFVLGQADLVLANSSFTAGKIQKIRNVDVQISPYGTTVRASFNPKKNIQDTEPFKVLFVGRHIERKGIRYLLQAAALLQEEAFAFRIVGHGDLTKDLVELSQSLQLQNVVFTGKLSQEELAQEYAKSDCFVLPAIVDSKGDTEGLGVVLVEAVNAGLVVVASEVGGIPDVVINGQTGILVPERSPEDLVTAFRRLRSDPGLCDHLVQGATEHAGRFYSWDGITDRLIALYQRL